LEALRRESVEALAVRLREAQARYDASAQATASASEHRHALEQRLRGERELFAGASSVRALQALERRLRALECELTHGVERERRAKQALALACTDLDALRQTLLEAERDRRAASGVLENRHKAQLRVSDRREEEEAEAAFRARSH
jgi:hypothetical protein